MVKRDVGGESGGVVKVISCGDCGAHPPAPFPKGRELESAVTTAQSAVDNKPFPGLGDLSPDRFVMLLYLRIAQWAIIPEWKMTCASVGRRASARRSCAGCTAPTRRECSTRSCSRRSDSPCWRAARAFWRSQRRRTAVCAARPAARPGARRSLNASVGARLYVTCPVCGWQVTWLEYMKSYKRHQLNLGGAGPAFEAYVRDFPAARSPQEKMLAVDRLIHAFHYSMSDFPDLPTRPAGVNLINGKMEDVIDVPQRADLWRRQHAGAGRNAAGMAGDAGRLPPYRLAQVDGTSGARNPINSDFKRDIISRYGFVPLRQPTDRPRRRDGDAGLHLQQPGRAGARIS